MQLELTPAELRDLIGSGKRELKPRIEIAGPSTAQLRAEIAATQEREIVDRIQRRSLELDTLEKRIKRTRVDAKKADAQYVIDRLVPEVEDLMRELAAGNLNESRAAAVRIGDRLNVDVPWKD